MASNAIILSSVRRSSSSSASRVTSSAKYRSENKCGPNNTPFMPATSPRPWWKSLVAMHTHGELQIQLWTKHSQTGMHEHSWQFLYRALITLRYLESQASSAVTKAMIGWVNQRQHANPHRLHKSDDHSLAIVVQCCLKLLITRGMTRVRIQPNDFLTCDIPLHCGVHFIKNIAQKVVKTVVFYPWFISDTYVNQEHIIH